jgi:hypothetical protein
MSQSREEAIGWIQEVAFAICPNEVSAEQPLKTVLEEAFEEEEIQTKPQVNWCPPPSAEEARFLMLFGGPNHA